MICWKQSDIDKAMAHQSLASTSFRYTHGRVVYYWIGCRYHISLSFYTMIDDIIIYVFMYNTKDKSRYWRRYGSASSCFETRRRSIKLCRTESPPISVRCRWFLRVRIDCDFIWSVCEGYVAEKRRRESPRVIVAWCQISHIWLNNTITS
jgi:hypothetical protein